MARPEKFLNPKTGCTFEYTEMLSKRGDLTPIYKDVVQKTGNGIISDFKCDYCGKMFNDHRATVSHTRFCPVKKKLEAEKANDDK